MSYSSGLPAPEAPRSGDRPRLEDITEVSPAIRAELLQRARGWGLAMGWVALLVLPAWTVVDRLVAPQEATAFLVLRLGCDIPIALCTWALAYRPFGLRRPELLTFLLLAVVQIEIGWMLPRVPQTDYYLLGSTLVLYASGCLLVSRPRYTAALIGTTGLAVTVAVATAPTPMPAPDVVGVAAYLATASLIALVAHVRRHQLHVRGLASRLRLEREQEHGQALLARLERLSGQDPLTGVANRRQWDTELAGACEQVRRHDGSLAVVLVDLDHVKQINDRHGHPGGDAALRAVSRLLSDSIRAGDLVARLGGDELALLLPGAGLARAAALAERLREGVAELTVPGCSPGEVTVSVGVAVAAGDLAFPLELMSQADRQLYRAKITRNAVAAPAGAALSRVPAPRRPLDTLQRDA